MKITLDLPDDTAFVVLTAIRGDSGGVVTTAHLGTDALRFEGILKITDKGVVKGETDDD